MSALPRRAAVAVAIAGLAALAGPASATGCRVDANADVTTAVATVHVSFWYDEGQTEPGVYGQNDQEITTSAGPKITSEGGDMHRSEGPGLVEEHTGVNVRQIVCGALES